MAIDSEYENTGALLVAAYAERDEARAKLKKELIGLWIYCVLFSALFVYMTLSGDARRREYQRKLTDSWQRNSILKDHLDHVPECPAPVNAYEFDSDPDPHSTYQGLEFRHLDKPHEKKHAPAIQRVWNTDTQSWIIPPWKTDGTKVVYSCDKDKPFDNLGERDPKSGLCVYDHPIHGPIGKPASGCTATELAELLKSCKPDEPCHPMCITGSVW